MGIMYQFGVPSSPFSGYLDELLIWSKVIPGILSLRVGSMKIGSHTSVSVSVLSLLLQISICIQHMILGLMEVSIIQQLSHMEEL